MAVSEIFLPLSTSPNGASILIGLTESPGILIHTSSNDVGIKDHLELFAINEHTSDVQIFIEWAGVTEKGPLIPFQKGPFRICSPRPISGGQTVRIFASVQNVIRVFAGSASTRIVTT